MNSRKTTGMNRTCRIFEKSFSKLIMFRQNLDLEPDNVHTPLVFLKLIFLSFLAFHDCNIKKKGLSFNLIRVDVAKI